jgi:hypothetical protein
MSRQSPQSSINTDNRLVTTVLPAGATSFDVHAIGCSGNDLSGNSFKNRLARRRAGQIAADTTIPFMDRVAAAAAAAATGSASTEWEKRCAAHYVFDAAKNGGVNEIPFGLNVLASEPTDEQKEQCTHGYQYFLYKKEGSTYLGFCSETEVGGETTYQFTELNVSTNVTLVAAAATSGIATSAVTIAAANALIVASGNGLIPKPPLKAHAFWHLGDAEYDHPTVGTAKFKRFYGIYDRIAHQRVVIGGNHECRSEGHGVDIVDRDRYAQQACNHINTGSANSAFAETCPVDLSVHAPVIVPNPADDDGAAAGEADAAVETPPVQDYSHSRKYGAQLIYNSLGQVIAFVVELNTNTLGGPVEGVTEAEKNKHRDVAQENFLKKINAILNGEPGSTQPGYSAAECDAIRTAPHKVMLGHHAPAVTTCKRYCKDESRKYRAGEAGNHHQVVFNTLQRCFSVDVATGVSKLHDFDDFIYAHEHRSNMSIPGLTGDTALSNLLPKRLVCVGGGGGVSNKGDVHTPIPGMVFSTDAFTYTTINYHQDGRCDLSFHDVTHMDSPEKLAGEDRLLLSCTQESESNDYSITLDAEPPIAADTGAGIEGSAAAMAGAGGGVAREATPTHDMLMKMPIRIYKKNAGFIKQMLQSFKSIPNPDILRLALAAQTYEGIDTKRLDPLFANPAHLGSNITSLITLRDLITQVGLGDITSKKKHPACHSNLLITEQFISAMIAYEQALPATVVDAADRYNQTTGWFIETAEKELLKNVKPTAVETILTAAFPGRDLADELQDDEGTNVGSAPATTAAGTTSSQMSAAAPAAAHQSPRRRGHIELSGPGDATPVASRFTVFEIVDWVSTYVIERLGTMHQLARKASELSKHTLFASRVLTLALINLFDTNKNHVLAILKSHIKEPDVDIPLRSALLKKVKNTDSADMQPIAKWRLVPENLAPLFNLTGLKQIFKHDKAARFIEHHAGVNRTASAFINVETLMSAYAPSAWMTCLYTCFISHPAVPEAFIERLLAQITTTCSQQTLNNFLRDNADAGTYYNQPGDEEKGDDAIKDAYKDHPLFKAVEVLRGELPKVAYVATPAGAAAAAKNTSQAALDYKKLKDKVAAYRTRLLPHPRVPTTADGLGAGQPLLETPESGARR